MNPLRATLLSVALFMTAICFASTVSAAPPIGGCNFKTNPCGDGKLVCFWVSQQVPQCVKDPGVVPAQDVCVTQGPSTHPETACAGTVCYGYSSEFGWTKCYGHPIPQCINICI